MMNAEGLSMLFLNIFYAKHVDSRNVTAKFISILLSNEKQIAKIE